MQPFDADKWLGFAVAVGMLIILMCSGCEIIDGGEDWSEEEIRNLVVDESGSVDINVGDNSTLQSIDTIDSAVRVTGGDNTTIGPINTAPPPAEEE